MNSFEQCNLSNTAQNGYLSWSWNHRNELHEFSDWQNKVVWVRISALVLCVRINGTYVKPVCLYMDIHSNFSHLEKPGNVHNNFWYIHTKDNFLGIKAAYWEFKQLDDFKFSTSQEKPETNGYNHVGGCTEYPKIGQNLIRNHENKKFQELQIKRMVCTVEGTWELLGISGSYICFYNCCTQQKPLIYNNKWGWNLLY